MAYLVCQLMKTLIPRNRRKSLIRFRAHSAEGTPEAVRVVKALKRCLSLLTFIPMDEVNRLVSGKDVNINEAKRVLAHTLTAQVHGKEAADKAQQAAEALFGGCGDSEHMPTRELTQEEL
ncbi:MAG TPA: hypothetical protein PK999_16360, partial [Nitrospira sp.]|nr:hypothetical protein [Nitrospira sp.]